MKFPVTGNVIFLAYFLAIVNMGGGRHFGRWGHAYGNFNVYSVFWYRTHNISIQFLLYLSAIISLWVWTIL